MGGRWGQECGDAGGSVLVFLREYPLGVRQSVSMPDLSHTYTGDVLMVIEKCHRISQLDMFEWY